MQFSQTTSKIDNQICTMNYELLHQTHLFVQASQINAAPYYLKTNSKLAQANTRYQKQLFLLSATIIIAFFVIATSLRRLRLVNVDNLFIGDSLTHHVYPFLQHRWFVSIDSIFENHLQKYFYARDNHFDCRLQCLPFFCILELLSMSTGRK